MSIPNQSKKSPKSIPAPFDKSLKTDYTSGINFFMSNSGLTKNQRSYQIARDLAKTSPKEYFLSFLHSQSFN